ncbi:MAG: hypothetical protein DSY66_00375 [Persephonella sp.]|nr:MAG: hypothetical protein DSY53_00020 [Persephonella sp.]RUM62227.1 MAG: hypothetical protein DSY66_00375 [Persephonella sp.]
MIKNKPFFIITAIGIFSTLIFLYIFVYGLAVRTVKSSVLIEKAYPNLTPAEYLNELKISASKNNLKILEVRKERDFYIIQMVNEKYLDEVSAVSPQATLLAIVNVVIYNLGDGVGVVATNPYLWDIIYPSNYIDDKAESFSNELSDIFDGIYWSLKEKKRELK